MVVKRIKAFFLCLALIASSVFSCPAMNKKGFLCNDVLVTIFLFCLEENPAKSLTNLSLVSKDFNKSAEAVYSDYIPGVKEKQLKKVPREVLALIVNGIEMTRNGVVDERGRLRDFFDCPPAEVLVPACGVAKDGTGVKKNLDDGLSQVLRMNWDLLRLENHQWALQQEGHGNQMINRTEFVEREFIYYCSILKKIAEYGYLDGLKVAEELERENPFHATTVAGKVEGQWQGTWSIERRGRPYPFFRRLNNQFATGLLGSTAHSIIGQILLGALKNCQTNVIGYVLGRRGVEVDEYFFVAGIFPDKTEMAHCEWEKQCDVKGSFCFDSFVAKVDDDEFCTKVMSYFEKKGNSSTSLEELQGPSTQDQGFYGELVAFLVYCDYKKFFRAYQEVAAKFEDVLSKEDVVLLLRLHKKLHKQGALTIFLENLLKQ